MAFDSAGDIWIANQGNHRIDVYDPSCLQNPWPTTGCLPITEITPPGGVSTTFDMRGLAIDLTSTPAHPTCAVFRRQRAELPCPGVQRRPDQPPRTSAFVANFNRRPRVRQRLRDPGSRRNGQFEDGARDIAVNGDHQVWVGDLGYFRAQVFDESGNFLNNVPGSGRATTARPSRPSVLPGRLQRPARRGL